MLVSAYHRKCAEQFLTDLDSDIDQAAKLDSFLEKGKQ